MNNFVALNQQHGPLVIDLQDWEHECGICGDDHLRRQGVPRYEDWILPNDWEGEWYGLDTCRRCYDAQGGLTKPMRQADFLRLVKGAIIRGLWDGPARELPG